ncbi:MAG: ATP-binding cassette domain-containing protein [Eubacteriales bacterium]|nr:ATP-binding cassette domain-containing protein [Eubacteriales bacterium]
MPNEALLRVQDMVKQFPIKQTLFEIIARKPVQYVRAVDHVSFDVERGETLGLVGESGCGKSTLAKTLSRLYTPDGGKVLFEDREIAAMTPHELQTARRKMQMIFQDPYSSLNPRMTVRQMMYEVLTVHKVCARAEREKASLRLLDLVGMDAGALDRYPSQFSGGQRQRISIARALITSPELLIADEPVSALDVSIQAQVINLLIELKQTLNLTMIFISHDLRVVRYLSDRVIVMYLGAIVETGPTEPLFDRPYHPYTDILMKAAPEVDPVSKGREYAIEGETPSPLHIPAGCRFHPRCPYAQEVCRTQEPELREVEPGRCVACHFRLGGQTGR